MNERDPERIVREREQARSKRVQATAREENQEAIAEARVLIPKVVETLERLDYPNNGAAGFTRSYLTINDESRLAWYLAVTGYEEFKRTYHILADGSLVVTVGYDAPTIIPLEQMTGMTDCMSRLRSMAKAGSAPKKRGVADVILWLLKGN